MEDRFVNDDILEEEIYSIIQDILIATDKAIRQNWLQEQVIPIAADDAMRKIEMMVNLATLSYDGSITSDIPLEVYTPDGEPAPASIDTWARGAGYLPTEFYNTFLVINIY